MCTTLDYASSEAQFGPTFLEMAMQQCPNCWEPMSITANQCPHCGHSESIATQPSKRRLGFLFWLLFLLMLAFAVLLVRYLGILS